MGYTILHLAPNHLSRNGSVTLLSGSSARTPVRGYGVWGTLHGSINALVRQAAIDLAPIRVNAVSPGGIGIRADQQLAEHRGQFEDVANMILAVVANPAVTAVIIDVDGGERLGTWNGSPERKNVPRSCPAGFPLTARPSLPPVPPAPPLPGH